MKFIISILLLNFCSAFMYGQIDIAIPADSNTKKYPMEFRNISFVLNDGYQERLSPDDKNFQDPKYSYMKYTDEQIKRIDFLLKSNMLPESLKGQNLERNRINLPYYVGYRIGNITSNKLPYYIIYIPRDENMHMPLDMIPPTDEGIFFSVYAPVPRFKNFTTRGITPPAFNQTVAQSKGNFSTSQSTEKWVNPIPELSISELKKLAEVKKVEYVKCPVCRGEGIVSSSSSYTTTTAGTYSQSQFGMGRISESNPTTTKSSGSKFYNVCGKCKGAGKVEK